MQADEIIQQKEWHELNTGEKEIVKELAETESEYNLLKKMLQVSAEEVMQVPVVSAHIKEKLSALVVVKKISYKRYLYAAAAVILVVILSTIFIRKGNDQQNRIVEKEPVKKVTEQAIVHIDIVPKDTAVINPVQKHTYLQIVVHNKRSYRKPKYDTRPEFIDHDQPVYAVVNKTISQEKELLDLVTEMY